MRSTILTALLLGWAALTARAAHTQVRLLLANEIARPGDTILAGVQLRMEPDWHTYWKNAGDSGIPTEIHWQLPPGIAAEPSQWPAPQKLVETEITTYIYTGEVVLLVPLKLARDLPPGPLSFKADVSWLECKVECVPGKAAIEAPLEIGPEPKPSKDAALLAEWQARMPKEASSLDAHAWWEAPATNESRPLLLQWKPTGAVSQPDFFPYPSTKYEVEAATEVLSAAAGDVRLRKQVKQLESGAWPKLVQGLLVQNSPTGRMAFDAALPVSARGEAIAGTTGPSIWLMLLYGFLGGLILNVMPCVLPVIALKILSFVNQAKEAPGRVRKLGLIYTAGVLASFLALALLAIGLKAAGHQAGWGMQFSNPQFVVVMIILVTLVALNLLGLFEVNPGGRLLNAAGALTSKKGAAGAFFNGVLATVLATSCTAAYLSLAIGFAFPRSAFVIIVTLLAVGFGMASPYLLLSWHPAWLRFLPKPGPWMEKFKIAMGFPMLATAVWLLSLLPDYYGSRAWWLGVFLIILALACWVFGEFVQRGAARRGLGVAVVLALLVAGYTLVLEGQLRWRSAGVSPNAASGPRDQPQGIAWQPWTPDAVTAARAEGRPILVDFTANWCLTCNSVVKPALENPAVREKIAQTHALALLGDYTHSPAEMTSELNRFGRAGVPLLVVYPRNPDAPAVVLPDPAPLSLPSHYSRVIVEALTRAAE